MLWVLTVEGSSPGMTLSGAGNRRRRTITGNGKTSAISSGSLPVSSESSSGWAPSNGLLRDSVASLVQCWKDCESGYPRKSASESQSKLQSLQYTRRGLLDTTTFRDHGAFSLPVSLPPPSTQPPPIPRSGGHLNYLTYLSPFSPEFCLLLLYDGVIFRPPGESDSFHNEKPCSPFLFRNVKYKKQYPS